MQPSTIYPPQPSYPPWTPITQPTPEDQGQRWQASNQVISLSHTPVPENMENCRRISARGANADFLLSHYFVATLIVLPGVGRYHRLVYCRGMGKPAAFRWVLAGVWVQVLISVPVQKPVPIGNTHAHSAKCDPYLVRCWSTLPPASHQLLPLSEAGLEQTVKSQFG